MLYLLLHPLKDLFSPLRLFGYITFRAAYVAVLAIVFAIVFGPAVIRLLTRRRIGQTIREEVPQRHKQKAGTPAMGGVLIILAILVPVLLLADLSNQNILILVLGAVWLGALGLYDDYVKIYKQKPRGLNKRTKLFWQGLYGLIVGLILYLLPVEPEIATRTNFIFLKNIIIDFGFLYPVFVAIVIVGASNAVNFSDGLDGLAIGLVGATAAGFAVLAYVSGHAGLSKYLNVIFVSNGGEVAIFIAGMLGAALGFLWFNAYPAQIFMGDVGSLALGGLIGTTAVLVKQEFLLILFGGVFVLEAASVVLQIVYFKATKGKRLFLMAPLHHHFELKGWAEPKITVRFWILQIIFVLLALSTLKIR